MMKWYFKIKLLPIFVILSIIMLPFIMHGNEVGKIEEKRIEVAMRMIGHEVLLCLGDHTSRVLPIEKIESLKNSNGYRILFEAKIGFDPDDIVSIIDRVMKENELSTGYLVQVEQCATKEINAIRLVHMVPYSPRPLGPGLSFEKGF